MNDELFRQERILSAISECVGVCESYELNIAETAFVAKCILQSTQAIIAERTQAAE